MRGAPLPIRAGSRVISLLIALLFAACSDQGSGFAISDAMYRPPLGGAKIGVGYLTIQSKRVDQIVGIESPMARSVEMHETVLTGTSSSMQQRREIDLPAKMPVVFGPGGLHLMIFEPQTLENRATFPIWIRLGSGEVIHVELAPWSGPADAG